MDGTGLLAVGTLIAALTALIKGAIPTTNYPAWVSVLVVGAIAAGVLGLAAATGRVDGDAFDLLGQWVSYVLAGVGVRELATVPSASGKTLTDLPTRGAP